jgi:GNAT superfamily N-acetyltransferase
MNANCDQALTIRLAGPEDAEILCSMVAELAAYEHLEASNVCSAEALRHELACGDKALEAVIASYGDEVAGMATFFQTYSTFAARRGLYLEDIYVRENYRHRGIGTRILAWVARLAHERGYGRVEWTTLLWNTPAIEFYESLGATPNDAWTTYRLDGEWLERAAAACGDH